MESTERKRPITAHSEYRRPSSAHPHYRRSNPAPPRRDIREKILLQIIISGALFLMVLVINMINIEPVRDLKASLKTALKESVSAEKLSEHLQGVGRYVTSVQDTVLTIFGNEPKEEGLPAPETLSGADEINAAGAETGEAEGSRGVDFRVDEELVGGGETGVLTQEKKQ